MGDDQRSLKNNNTPAKPGYKFIWCRRESTEQMLPSAYMPFVLGFSPVANVSMPGEHWLSCGLQFGAESGLCSNAILSFSFCLLCANNLDASGLSSNRQ